MPRTITLASARAAHPLAPAVLRQLGGGREAVETCIDAANCGADAGWPGFTTYSETIRFALRNRTEIRKALADYCVDGGGIAAMVAEFPCLRNCETTIDEVSEALYGDPSNMSAGSDLVLNALAWFALETVGHAIEGGR